LKDGTVRELRRCYYGGGVERDSDALFDNIETSSFLLIGRDPAWYDQDQVTITAIYSDFTHGLYASTLTLDDTDGLTTAGDWYTYPIITIYGPCTSFDLRSTTTGQRLRYTGVVLAGETVTLTTNPHIVTAVSDVSGNVETNIPPSDDFGGFALWPYPLATDGDNEWELEVVDIDANSQFRFTWEDRYQGI
jgi:hypothetical protein